MDTSSRVEHTSCGGIELNGRLFLLENIRFNGSIDANCCDVWAFQRGQRGAVQQSGKHREFSVSAVEFNQQQCMCVSVWCVCLCLRDYKPNFHLEPLYNGKVCQLAALKCCLPLGGASRISAEWGTRAEDYASSAATTPKNAQQLSCQVADKDETSPNWRVNTGRAACQGPFARQCCGLP